MNQEFERFNTFLKDSLFDISNHRKIALEFEINKSSLELLDQIIDLINSLIKITVDGELKINYLNQFRENILIIINSLPYRGRLDSKFLQDQNKTHICSVLESINPTILQQYESIKFSIDFFKKINFFNNNVVAIGANGSGKTSLSNKFKNYLQNNGVVISAQRVLLVRGFQSINNPTKTADELKKIQQKDKTNKNPDEFGSLSQEFEIVLKNLLAENISIGNEYRRNSVEQVKLKKNLENPPTTNLDRTLNIWNSLIEHRQIDCKDGMNISVESETIRSYPVSQMSDGEKVMLYLVSQVLQAPKDGFIVVDEPEMYLHKTILKKLWDMLEKERPDCLFIYLTHDLDFATSRATAKKIWIKSFVYPDNWIIENIPDNEIPETGCGSNLMYLCEKNRIHHGSTIQN